MLVIRRHSIYHIPYSIYSILYGIADSPQIDVVDKDRGLRGAHALCRPRLFWHNHPRFIYCSATVAAPLPLLFLLLLLILLLLLWSLLWHKFHFKKHKIRARVFLAIPFIWFTISLNQLMDTLRSSPRSATITRTVLSFYLSLPASLPSAAPADHLSLSVQVTGRQTPTNYVYGQTAASCNQVAGTRKLGLRMLF